MFLARVTGTVVATARVAGLDGVPLLLVEPVDDDGRPNGKPQIATDAVQAGLGELVFVVTGREAALALPDTFVPVDLSVVGHVDDVNVARAFAAAVPEKPAEKPAAPAKRPSRRRAR